MAFDRQQIKAAADALARHNIYIGTSSWKYAGWRGMLYDEGRYVYRGKVAESRFEKNCLSEYAGVFKTVCVDAAYYTFPSRKYLQGLSDQVPDDFRFAFKVTDEITVKHFPNLPRFGGRAGKPNENFLNADLFTRAFLEPCEPFRSKIGVLMFEFSRFYPRDYARGSEFADVLEAFLARLPRGWPYAVEIRNRNFLHPEYFAILARHNVAHVFNSWTDMPSVNEQMAMAGIRTAPGLCAARFLLRPGRDYQEAVELFQPYTKTREAYAEAREAGAALMKESLKETRRGTYVYVNNRLEGNALETIAAMIELLGML
jgi:uncharacterized protein YecE (DUF72 family)